VAELLDRISSSELSEWIEFYDLEPFGCDTGFLGHAITAQTVANANRGKGQRPFKVEDFMPQFGKEPQSEASMKNFAAMMTAALGGVDKRKIK
jgi:hypothetical protein